MSDLATKLRGDRTVAVRGQLTLDRTKARTKLQQFRLADPHFYVLQFVRAASVLGASSITFEVRPREMRCTFDVDLPGARLSDFWSSAFEERRTREDIAMHHIALGVGSAQALNPERIVVRTGSSELILTPDGERLTERSEQRGGTQIDLVEKWKFGHLLEFFDQLSGELAEAVALRDYCRFSMMNVIVNGDSVLERPGVYPTKFKTASEDGFVRLTPEQGVTSTFAFLRDNVLVQTHLATAHRVAATAVLNSQTLRTDLSGLRLAADANVDELLNEHLYSAYHTSLEQWAKKEASNNDLLRIGVAVFDHAASLERAGTAPPSGTKSLSRYIMQQRFFPQADRSSGAEISMQMAMHGGTIAFATQLFRDVSLPEHPRVLLVEEAIANPAAGSWTSRRLVDAFGRMKGVRLIDVTVRLEAAQIALKNRKRWEKRPIREAPTWPLQFEVTHGGARGFVYLPVQQSSLLLDEAEVGARVHIGGRLVRRHLLALPLGIDFDGDFEPDDKFEDIRRDTAFEELVLSLLGQVPALLHEYAKELIQQTLVGVEPRRVLDQFVVRWMIGEFAKDFFVAAGFSTDRATSLVRHHDDRFTRLGDFDDPESRVSFLARLGPMADVPSYECAGALTTTLRSIVQSEHPPQLASVSFTTSGIWDRQLAWVDKHGGFEKDRPIVFVDHLQENIVRGLRPDSIAAQEAIDRRVRKVAYAARPRFELEHEDVLAELREQDGEGGMVFELELLRKGLPNTCTAFVVYRDRLLSIRRLPVALGSFRAVIRSDRFSATAEFDDVVEDITYFGAQLRVTDDLCGLLLGRWWSEAARTMGVKPDLQELFLRYAFAHAAQRAAFPVLMRSQGQWVPVLLGKVDLEAMIERDGDVLSYSRTDAPRPEALFAPDSMVLRIGEMSTRELAAHISGVRFVDAGGVRPGRSEKLYDAWLRTSSGHRELPWEEALVVWSGRVRGIDLEVGICSDPTGAARNRVHVLWESRVLESLEVDVPFGNFMCTASGGAISPNPTYEFAASGRAAVLEAAVVGAANAVRWASRSPGALGRQFASPTAGRVVLEPLRLDLIRYLGLCQQSQEAPFDLRATLEKAPLFKTATTRRLSFNELADISHEGVISYSADARFRDDVLRIRPENLLLHETTLGDRYGLMPVAEVDALLGDEERHFHQDLVLNKIVTLLVDARGDRRDLFDDHLGYSIMWATRDLGSFCVASPVGLEVQYDHRLSAQLRENPDDLGVLGFVASAVYSSVNRYYRKISDTDEVTLQRRLMARLRELDIKSLKRPT